MTAREQPNQGTPNSSSERLFATALHHPALVREKSLQNVANNQHPADPDNASEKGTRYIISTAETLILQKTEQSRHLPVIEGNLFWIAWT